MKSGFYIDIDEIKALQKSLGANRQQLAMAYNRALKKTMKKLHLNSVKLMTAKTGAVKPADLKKHRVRVYHVNTGHRGVPGTGRVWFGLNDMPVSALKGQMKNPPGRTVASRERDAKGRFLPRQGGGGATFRPRAPDLSSLSFPGGFVATFRGKKSIYLRIPGSPFLREALLPVMDAVVKGISTDIFSEANDMLMRLFEQELAGLVSRGYGK